MGCCAQTKGSKAVESALAKSDVYGFVHELAQERFSLVHTRKKSMMQSESCLSTLALQVLDEEWHDQNYTATSNTLPRRYCQKQTEESGSILTPPGRWDGSHMKTSYLLIADHSIQECLAT